MNQGRRKLDLPIQSRNIRNQNNRRFHKTGANRFVGNILRMPGASGTGMRKPIAMVVEVNAKNRKRDAEVAQRQQNADDPFGHFDLAQLTQKSPAKSIPFAF
jgi:hypothetical protein